MERIVRRWCETCGVQWDGQASDPCPRIELGRCVSAAPAVAADRAAAELRRALDEARRSAPPLQLQDTEPAVSERLSAGLGATLTDLAAVVAIVRRAGSYLAPEDQLALGAAKARLVAAGRSVA